MRCDEKEEDRRIVFIRKLWVGRRNEKEGY